VRTPAAEEATGAPQRTRAGVNVLRDRIVGRAGVRGLREELVVVATLDRPDLARANVNRLKCPGLAAPGDGPGDLAACGTCPNPQNFTITSVNRGRDHVVDELLGDLFVFVRARSIA